MKKTTMAKLGALIAAVALGLVLAGCPTSGGGGGGGNEKDGGGIDPDNSLVGTWRGVDSEGNTMNLILTSTTWKCTDSSGNSWKGPYTLNGNVGAMTITHLKYQGGGWRSASGYGTGTVTGDTLSGIFVITSEGFPAISATFTRQ